MQDFAKGRFRHRSLKNGSAQEIGFSYKQTTMMKISKFFKLTAAMLACVSAIAVTSCDNNDDPKGSGLKFDPADVAVAPGATVTSGDAQIATASVNDNTITITGVEEGTTAVVVMDDKVAVKGVKAGTTSITVTDKDKKTGTISVTVK